MFLAGNFEEVAVFVSGKDLRSMVHEKVAEVAAALGTGGARHVSDNGQFSDVWLSFDRVSFHDLCTNAVNVVGSIKNSVLGRLIEYYSGQAIYNEELLGLVLCLCSC